MPTGNAYPGTNGLGGGGGGGSYGYSGGNGGSGIVIVRYESSSISVSPSTLNFGSTVYVGTTNVLTNTVSGFNLTDNITITVAPSSVYAISTNAVDYSSSLTLTTNASGNVPATNIYVRFTPAVAGSYPGAITNISGSVTQLVTLAATAIVPGAPTLYVTPGSLAFGNVITNKISTTNSYTVTGSNLTADVSVSAPAGFQVATNGGAYVTTPSTLTLVPDATSNVNFQVNVIFVPPTGGTYSASITNSTAGFTNSVSLTGAGVVQALYVSPATLPFGYVATNTTANTSYTVWGSNLEANVTVTAPSAAFTVSTNNLTGFGASCTVLVANANAPSGASLTSTPVYVKFTPTALGAYSGAITNSSVGAANQTNAVTGTGVNPPATVSITAPAANQIFNNGDSVSLTATVVPGTAPYWVNIYTNRFSGGYGVATNATGSSTGFTVSLGALTAGTYHVYATVTDSVSAVVFTSATNTFIVQPPVTARLLASGGDVTTIYTNLSSGRIYACHQYTNVGDAAFVPIQNLKVEYLVIGGGGGGGGGRAGGGGAGGYRCSVTNELSGSNSTAEAIYSVSAGIPYRVGVGVGGAGGANTSTGNKGGDSWFTNIVSTGGGGGRERTLGTGNPNGGSGGGGGYGGTGGNDGTGLANTGGVAVAGQGFKGGNAGGNDNGITYSYGGGGGGAGSPGTAGNLLSDPWGSGGTGLVSQITGVAVGRAGGGGGNYGATPPGTPWGVATNYGGGIDITGRRDGATSTGGGGGPYWFGTGGNGGSGVVILRYDITAPKGTVFIMR